MTIGYIIVIIIAILVQCFNILAVKKTTGYDKYKSKFDVYIGLSSKYPFRIMFNTITFVVIFAEIMYFLIFSYSQVIIDFLSKKIC